MRGRKPTPNPKTASHHDRLRAPSWLPDDAKSLYRTLADMLAGTLRQLDSNTLASYCLTFSRWKQAEAEVSATGLVLQTQYGPRANPACKLADAYAKNLRLLAQELGLSPLARERIAMAEQDQGAADLEEYTEYRA